MEPIDRKRLMRRLGLDYRIPKEHTNRWSYVPIENRDGRIMFHTSVVLLPSRGKKHRVLICCPNCGNMIPFGRLHQHKGMSTCVSYRFDDIALENEIRKIKDAF